MGRQGTSHIARIGIIRVDPHYCGTIARATAKIDNGPDTVFILSMSYIWKDRPSRPPTVVPGGTVPRE